jgi:hypothetical protein
VTGDEMLLTSSSVGVKMGSIFMSRGLLVSEVGVSIVGFGLVGSRPDGYERGSGRRIPDRDDLEDAIDGAKSLLFVDEENVDAIERRERKDELVDDVYDDAVELRPE